MIFDSRRTKDYNKFSIGRDDIEQLGKTSKIVWNRTAPPGTKRPHDFCTLMHGEIFANGTHVLMTTATSHAKAKPSNEYLRSEIVLGINHMVPVVSGGGLSLPAKSTPVRPVRDLPSPARPLGLALQHTFSSCPPPPPSPLLTPRASAAASLRARSPRSLATQARRS